MQQQPEGCRSEQGGQIDAMYALMVVRLLRVIVVPLLQEAVDLSFPLPAVDAIMGDRRIWSCRRSIMERTSSVVSPKAPKPLNPGLSGSFGAQWFSNKSASNTAPDPVLQTGRITAVPSIQLNAPFKLNELTQSKLLGEKTNLLFFEIKDRLFVRKYHH